MIPNSTTIVGPHHRFQGWTTGSNARGSLDIIWSCLSTLALLTWSSLCVNVPRPGTNTLRLLRRKASLTALGLLGPEYIVLLALGQWRAARETLRAFNRHNWTPWSLRHAFCAEMGFWVVETRDGVKWPLNGKELVYLVEEGHISASEMKDKVLVDTSFINDRNKVDTLLRVIALAQVIWFVINCIARVAQRLPLTTLELTVLSFFVPNLFTSFLWYHKPTDVGTSVVLHLDATVQELQQNAHSCYHPHALDHWYQSPLEFIGRVEWHGSIIYTYCTNILWLVVSPIWKRELQRPIQTRSDFQFPRLGLKLEFVEAIFACIFFGFNFIAWNWDFPTNGEQLAWRLAATGMTATFVVGCTAEFLTALFCPLEYSRLGMRNQRAIVEEMKKHGNTSSRPECWRQRLRAKWLRIAVRLRNNSPDEDPSLDVPLMLLLPALPLMALYVGCRLAIFVEDGLAFRAQPRDVYKSVNWSAILPHIA